jgi:NADP-dependent 3-hydroxy acid dehydrogenase YdfG
MTDLNVKVAIVTGGVRGIGAAVARGLADGARVIVNYSHSERPANEVVENIKSDGSEAKTVRADMSDPASIKVHAPVRPDDRGLRPAGHPREYRRHISAQTARGVQR